MEFIISDLRKNTILSVDFSDDDIVLEFEIQYRDRMEYRNKYARKSYYKQYLAFDRSLINMFLSYNVSLDLNETRYSYNIKQLKLHHRINYEYLYMRNIYNEKYFYPKFKILQIHKIDAAKLPDKTDINKMIEQDRFQLKTMFEEIYQDELNDNNKEYYFTD